MQVTEARVLHGRNIYGPRSVLRLTIDAGDVPPDMPADIADRVGDALGIALADRSEQAQAPARVAALLADTVAGLLRPLGVETDPVAIAGDDGTDRFAVVYAFEDSETAVAAGRLAFDAIRTVLFPGGPAPQPDLAARASRFKANAGPRQMSVECRALARSAQERDIPWLYAGDHMLLFGQGRRMKRMMRKFTSDTSQVGFRLAQDKAATNRILRALGLPVPRQLIARSEKAALDAARTIGLPVAIKPLNADFGLGVSLDLRSAQAVSRAYQRARQHGQTVLVEQFVAGSDHRILVVGDTVVAVAQRIRAHVIGDGKRTIGQLIDAVNQDSRRGDKHSSIQVRLTADDDMRELLAESGHTLEKVPAADQVVYLRRVATPSNGGYSVDLTDKIHPDNRVMAVRAVKAMGIDVSGIDYITTDISRSFRESGGVICEVNASPALRPHMAAEGPPRDVTGPIIDQLFPDPAAARIPSVLVLDREDTTATAGVRQILDAAGYTVGCADRNGITVGGFAVHEQDTPLATAMMMLARDPQADATVAACRAEDIVTHGLGIDRCSVSIVLATDGQEAGGRQEAAELLATAAATKVILDADDPQCLTAADGIDPATVCLLSASPSNAWVESHVKSGQSAAYLSPDTNGYTLFVVDDGAEHRFPCRRDVTQADLAAACAGYFLGLAPDAITVFLTGEAA